MRNAPARRTYRPGRSWGASALLCTAVLTLPALARRMPIDLRPVSAAVARRQLEALAQVLERYHPTLREPAARERFEQELRTLERSARGTLPTWRDWLLQQQLVRTLDDPHTALYPILIERRFLPVRLHWVADGILISPAAGAGAPPFPAESELLRLGRYDRAALFEKLRQLTPGTRTWVEQINSLPGYLLYWLGLLDAHGRVEMTIRTPAGAVRQITLGLATLPADRAKKRIRKRDRHWFGWRLYPRENVGWFSLNAMRVTPAYERAVAAFFQAVERAGITRVAVDLREDEGGSSFAGEPFLLQMGVTRYRDYLKIQSLDPKSLRAQLERLERLLKKRLPRQYVAHMPVPSAPPAGRRFRGTLYIVTGPRTFSSAMEFAADVKYNHIGRIIGEPPGETVTGPGEVLEFREHPPSGIPMQVSTRVWTWPGLPQGALVQPDIPVPLTMSDVREGIDPVRAWFRATARGAPAAPMPAHPPHAPL
jgi:hypothetical protein